MHQKIATVTLSSPPCSCINCNATLAQEKTHTVTFLGVKDVTSSTKFYLGRGASPTHNDSIWMKESTLECSSLNRSPHTWCKVIAVSGCWQHCTFNKNKMVHLGHLSTIVQALINLCTPLSPPQQRTSLPSLHRLQQLSNHFSTVSYLVTIITSTQFRERHLIRSVKLCTPQRDKG